MPTVYHEHGLAFRIYPDDHAPPHVHAVRGDSEYVRILLGDTRTPPSLWSVHGLKKNDVRRALASVTAHQMELLAEWRRIHGP